MPLPDYATSTGTGYASRPTGITFAVNPESLNKDYAEARWCSPEETPVSHPLAFLQRPARAAWLLPAALR